MKYTARGGGGETTHLLPPFALPPPPSPSHLQVLLLVLFRGLILQLILSLPLLLLLCLCLRFRFVVRLLLLLVLSIRLLLLLCLLLRFLPLVRLIVILLRILDILVYLHIHPSHAQAPLNAPPVRPLRCRSRPSHPYSTALPTLFIASHPRSFQTVNQVDRPLPEHYGFNLLLPPIHTTPGIL